MSRVKFAEKDNFFSSSFLNFAGFWSKNFSDFWPKNVKILSKLPSTCPEEHFVAWIFFRFWIVSDFLQKPLAWFSSFYLRVQSKTCGRKSILIFLFRNFFGFWAKNFSDFWPKSSRSCQNYLLRVQINNLRLKKFLKFWSVLHFLQKPSAWFSKFYLRVQSKNFRRNSFLIFLFRIFSDFEQNFFQTFGEKSSKNCQNYLLRVQRNILWLELFLSFESFPIFCRNHWHGSKKSIYVSRVKIAEEIIFLILLFRVFFRILREAFFRLLAKKLLEVFKTTFYVSRGTVCGLKFFSMVLKILSTCPE